MFVGGWAAVTFFLKSTFEDFKISDSKPLTLFSSLFNVGCDVVFAVVLVDEEFTVLLSVGAALIVSTLLVNGTVMLRALRFETKTNPNFWDGSTRSFARTCPIK